MVLPPMRAPLYFPGALGGLGTRMSTGSTLTAALPVDSMVGATAISAGVMVTPSGLQHAQQLTALRTHTQPRQSRASCHPSMHCDLALKGLRQMQAAA